MASIAGSVFFVLAFASLTSFCEGGCHQPANEVIQMCRTGTLTRSRIFVDANVTIQDSERCSCNVRQTENSNLFVGVVRGSIAPDCTTRVRFFRPSSNITIHEIYCTTTEDYDENLAPNSYLTFNLTGIGRMNSCWYMESSNAGSQLTIECTERTQDDTTGNPTPSTRPPRPTTPTPAPTTQTAAPTTQSPAPTTQPPGSTTQPSGSTSQTPGATTQPPGTTTQPPSPTTQPPGATTQPPGTTTQPPSPTTQPPGATTQPSEPTTQPPGATTQPTSSTTQPPGPTTQPPTTSAAPVQGTTEAVYRFPVPEVAGGVAAGIFVIILLVVCVTCCTSRKRSERKPDEESLKGRESPEMQENKEGRGYAFDNLLYHASQRDLSGKSVTPTVSEGGDSVYQATKGFNDLYASVNKSVTESTDIM